MDRRTFIAGLVAAATAAGVAGCSSDDTGSGTSSGPGDDDGSTTGGGDASFATSPFTLGIASGDPLATSVILWTRLALDPLAADGNGGLTDDVTVQWEVASNEGFEDVVASGDATALAALGHSVHVDATGLEPGRRYHYRFRVGDHVSPTGRTGTAPDDDADVDELRIGLASCQNFGTAHYAAHRSMAEDDLDLVLFLGDYIYEYATNDDELRPVPGGKCISLADYRNRYAFYHQDTHLQASRASCPWIVTWDDHEVENNYAALESDVGTSVADMEVQRAAAYQAYYEHQPLRLDPPEGADFAINRTAKWGRLADIFVLDGRQYRDPQPCDSVGDAMVRQSECDIEGAGADMLGADQEAWLTGGLTSASATWKVLAQQTVMSALVLGDIVLNVDQWDGYPQARRRLLDHIAAEQISDVVVVTGDIHAAGCGVLRTDGTNGEARPVAVEFVCTSISSNGLAELVGLDSATLDPAIFGLPFAELVHRGYSRCTITPQQWQTEYMIVADAADPDSEVTVAATVTAPQGTPALTVA